MSRLLIKPKRQQIKKMAKVLQIKLKQRAKQKTKYQKNLLAISLIKLFSPKNKSHPKNQRDLQKHLRRTPKMP